MSATTTAPGSAATPPSAPAQLREAIARRVGSPWTGPIVMAAVGVVGLVVGIVAVARSLPVAGSPVLALLLGIVLLLLGVGAIALVRLRGGSHLPGWYAVAVADVAFVLATVISAPTVNAVGVVLGLVVLSSSLLTGRLRGGRVGLSVLDFFAAVGVLVAFQLGRSGSTTFNLATGTDFVQLPPITVPGVATVLVLAIVLVILAVLGHLPAVRTARDKLPAWLFAVFVIVFFVAFLVWAAAGLRAVPVPGLLLGGLALATPLVFGSLGGVLGERAGVVNVAIDGQLLFGAFSAALVGSATHNPWAGLLAAIVAGVLVSWVLAVFALRYWVDQVIVGVVLNVLVTGLTNFFYTKLFAPVPDLNHTSKFPEIAIPGLAQIPIIGPVLFKHTLIVYVMYIAVFVVWFALFKTRWGLRVRSVGEHPQAADTVGINVNRTRFWTVSIAGAVAGIGGAFYTLDSLSSFGKEMTNGAGFIALAAVIFGQWHPVKAALAGLLFGFAFNLQQTFQTIGSPIPGEFLLMLPYVITIVAVAGLVGQSRAPAADGTPYIKA